MRTYLRDLADDEVAVDAPAVRRRRERGDDDGEEEQDHRRALLHRVVRQMESGRMAMISAALFMQE
jgi:hypothetical protein